MMPLNWAGERNTHIAPFHVIPLVLSRGESGARALKPRGIRARINIKKELPRVATTGGTGKLCNEYNRP